MSNEMEGIIALIKRNRLYNRQADRSKQPVACLGIMLLSQKHKIHEKWVSISPRTLIDPH